MKVIRVLYSCVYVITTVMAVVLTVCQPISWQLEKQRNQFLIEHFDQSPLRPPLPGKAIPPKIYAEIKMGRQHFFDDLVRKTPLIPTIRQTILFFTTLIISMILVFTWRYRHTHKLKAISDDQFNHHKIQTLLVMLPLIIGYACGLLFIFGLALINRCWQNPNCEGKVLAIPLVLSVSLWALNVLLVEAIFWCRRLAIKPN